MEMAKYTNVTFVKYLYTIIDTWQDTKMELMRKTRGNAIFVMDYFHHTHTMTHSLKLSA